MLTFAAMPLIECETMSYGGDDYDYDQCGNLPRLCYSCASSSFEKDWLTSYKDFYQLPKNFTQSCQAEINDKHVPLVECDSPCLTIVEEVYLFGIVTLHTTYTIFNTV